MTLEQAEEVFELLGHPFLRVFARDRSGRTMGETILDPRQLATWSGFWTERGFNLYVQMNPTKRKGTGRVSTADISHWNWFLVDLDPISETPKLDLAKEFVEMFMYNYLGIKHLHYTLIDSGRGWQMWFPLPLQPLRWQDGPMDMKIAVHTQPLPRMFELEDFDETNTIEVFLREAAPRAMSYWLNFLKERMELVLPACGVTIDTSVSDLPRVMRLPYTENFKTGRPTSILRKQIGINVGLGNKLIAYAPYKVWKKEEYDAYEMADNATWHHYLTHPGMKVNARIYLTEGVSEGGRHKAATAALLTLKELGCDATQVEAALLWGARLCSPQLEPREITPMIDRHFQRRTA